VIADAGAIVMARTPIDPAVIGRRYAYREWFTGQPDLPPASAPAVAVPRLQTSITRAFRSTAAERAVVVSVASPIWGSERGVRRVVGVISATIHLDTFNQWLVEAEGDKNAFDCPARFAVLLNQSQLVRHPCPAAGSPALPVEPAEYADRDAPRTLLQAADRRAAEFADPLRSGRVYLAAAAPLRENPAWHTIVEFDRESSLAHVTRLARQFGIIGLIAAGIGLTAVIGLWLMLFHLTRAPSSLRSKAPAVSA
jgi:hypothetical protein